MSKTLKNTVMLGSAVVFLLVFFVYEEINRSQALITVALDPVVLVNRGFKDAEADFKDGFAYFKSVKGIVPGITDLELKQKYAEYAPFRSARWCFRLYIEEIALYLNDYENNEHFILAYNTRLKALIDNGVSLEE